ncbi:MAG: hypothetical protein LBI34_04135 [Puniceicoccales bacterium]|jgi:dihydrofolate synthase/folylpolyglutamate synthase|nr:hypothetical protein [Puniceicoccales bacterium]
MDTLGKCLRDLVRRTGTPGKWDLARVRCLARKMAVPLKKNYIHIGGTNGKGSVCAMLEAGFRATGMKTGCYTSPHLIRWNERVQINGNPIADEDFRNLLREALAFADEILNTSLSCFEILTVTALAYFARETVDIAIIEVGLGGRLDATNIIIPEVAAITTIGMDHEEVLGDTLEAIAMEKAGIGKDGIPLVLGDMPENALEKIRSVVQAPIILANYNRWVPQFKYLHGVEQMKNAPVALAVAEAYFARTHSIKEARMEHFFAGVIETRWPGRWEKRSIAGRTWIFDCTHNACGLPFLQANWEKEYLPAPTIITAMLGFHRARALLPYLASIAGQLILVQLDEPRALTTELLRELVPLSFAGEIVAIKNLENLSLMITGNGPVLVTGSIFLIGRILEAFDGS